MMASEERNPVRCECKRCKEGKCPSHLPHPCENNTCKACYPDRVEAIKYLRTQVEDKLSSRYRK